MLSIALPNTASDMYELSLEIATRNEQTTLHNLMQLYTHDFSEHWSGTNNGDLHSDGRFADYPLDAYWQAPDHIPFLIRIENHPIGFALLNNASHTGSPVDRNMAEFFIVRKHRRNGVGVRAAHTLFTRYPGRWETAVARRNIVALAFWRRTVAQHASVSDVQELDVSSSLWNGPVIRFQVTDQVGRHEST
jgi:predicted acetyltransferase